MRCFVFLLAILVQADSGAARPAYCNDPTLDKPGPPVPGTVPRPAPNRDNVRPGSRSIKINGKSVNVNFENHAAKIQPPKGTVVYMCGGPGIVCTNEGRPRSIPPDMDVIVFDYLGTGQNERVPSTQHMAIESQGQVAAGIVKSLNLQDYVLYGSSFGTTVATVAASQLSRDAGAIKPKTVILDGVVSRGQDLNHEAAVTRAAGRAWELLSSEDQNKFISAYDEKIKSMTLQQREELDGDLIAKLEATPRFAADSLKAFVAGTFKPWPRTPQSEATNRQFRAAGCQQLRPRRAPVKDRFFGGRVQNTRIGVDPAGASTPCDCPLLKGRFDSQAHQIKDVPILYINSETDVLTPIEGAKRHVDTQKQAADKLLVSVRDGGHGDLEGLNYCSGFVWNAAMAGSLSTVRSQLNDVQNNGCNTVSATLKTGTSQ